MTGSGDGRGGEQKKWHSAELEGLGSLAVELMSNLREAVQRLQAGNRTPSDSKSVHKDKSGELDGFKGLQDEKKGKHCGFQGLPQLEKSEHCLSGKERPSEAHMREKRRRRLGARESEPPVREASVTKKASETPPRLASLSLASTPSSDAQRPPGQPGHFHVPVDIMWGTWEEEDDDDIIDDVGESGLAAAFGGNERLQDVESEPRGDEASTSSRAAGGGVEEGEALCYEVVKGRRRRYVKGGGGSKGLSQAGYTVIEEGEKRNLFQLLSTFACSYVVPEGFPESVSAAYAPYMRWRASQYFFGGAMGVFTTRSLLHSIGVSRGGAPTAVAVNWAIKDGAGRIGKMLFARQGKKFDCDLKQVRFAGGLLMELGAAVELATTVCPQFFLPLACAANISKNVAAVTATSTRAPIYKAFARRENLGDVTAKGESISNMADLMGMGFGILLSKRNPSLLATFGVLSCGYLLSSYNECRSIQLPTLNRARFSVAVRTFLESGSVPAPTEANRREAIVVPPWAAEKPMELGVKVSDAFGSAQEFQAANQLFKNEKYVVTYRKKKRRAFVVLKEDAQPADVLRAAFQAHVLLHILHGCPSKSDSSLIKGAPAPAPTHPSSFTLKPGGSKPSIRKVTEADVAAALQQSCVETDGLFDDFRKKASAEGWVMADALLNPGDARLCTGGK